MASQFQFIVSIEETTGSTYRGVTRSGQIFETNVSDSLRFDQAFAKAAQQLEAMASNDARKAKGA